MLIDRNIRQKLLGYVRENPEESSRILMHTKDSNLVQVMLIAIGIKKYYDYIRDNQSGYIIFTILEGKLCVSTITDDKTKNIYTLNSGDILKIPRNIFRATKAIGPYPALYLEVIEGSFRREARECIIE